MFQYCLEEGIQISHKRKQLFVNDVLKYPQGPWHAESPRDHMKLGAFHMAGEATMVANSWLSGFYSWHIYPVGWDGEDFEIQRDRTCHHFLKIVSTDYTAWFRRFSSDITMGRIYSQFAPQCPTFFFIFF